MNYISGCSPAYCGFDGGDCILIPLYLRGSVILTFGLHPQELEARSSEILRQLALVAHTVLFLQKGNGRKYQIDEVTGLKDGSVIQTIELKGLESPNTNIGWVICILKYTGHKLTCCSLFGWCNLDLFDQISN